MNYWYKLRGGENAMIFIKNILLVYSLSKLSELTKSKNVIANSIISIEISINIIFVFSIKKKPIIPIVNKISDKLIVNKL
jgi:hypothetical protein